MDVYVYIRRCTHPFFYCVLIPCPPSSALHEKLSRTHPTWWYVSEAYPMARMACSTRSPPTLPLCVCLCMCLSYLNKETKKLRSVLLSVRLRSTSGAGVKCTANFVLYICSISASAMLAFGADAASRVSGGARWIGLGARRLRAHSYVYIYLYIHTHTRVHARQPVDVLARSVKAKRGCCCALCETGETKKKKKKKGQACVVNHMVVCTRKSPPGE